MHSKAHVLSMPCQRHANVEQHMSQRCFLICTKCWSSLPKAISKNASFGPKNPRKGIKSGPRMFAKACINADLWTPKLSTPIKTKFMLHSCWVIFFHSNFMWVVIKVYALELPPPLHLWLFLVFLFCDIFLFFGPWFSVNL